MGLVRVQHEAALCERSRSGGVARRHSLGLQAHGAAVVDVGESPLEGVVAVAEPQVDAVVFQQLDRGQGVVEGLLVDALCEEDAPGPPHRQ
eukprot:7522991-Alexandrium_andersonii.AAC.1